MKHTKNILKSLLITVMALSLLAVSCKKDEGGSKPTDPTPITITVDNITTGFTALGKTKDIGGVVFDFSAFTANKQAVELTAQSGKASSINTLKTALGNLGITIAGATVLSAVEGEIKDEANNAATVKVTITPSANNTFDAKVGESYTVNNTGAVEVTLTLKPNTGKKWTEAQ